MATSAIETGRTGTRLMLWTLLIVYVFNFLDRQIVNILAEPIARDLSLTDTQIGLMTGLAFALFYTVLGIPIARYADRPTTSRPRVIALALAIWSVMTALCGLAQNYTQLLLARIGVGVGEAGCTPAAHSLIAESVPKEKRSGALAFYALGIPAGTLLGMMIGGFLNDTLGWRKAFMVVGVPGLLLAMIVLLILRDPRKVGVGKTISASRPQLGGMQTFKTIFGSKALILLLIAGSSASFLSYGKVTWATIYFQRTHGLSPSEVGFYFGIVNGAMGLTGTWLGGWLADRFGEVNRRHVLTAPALGMLVGAPLAFWGYSAGNWTTSLALLAIPTLLNSLYYGPTYSSVQGLVPREAGAMASAVMLFCQNLIGLGLGPLLFGMLSDSLKLVYGADSVQVVLYVAAFLGLLPAFFFWRCSLRLNEELDRKD